MNSPTVKKDFPIFKLNSKKAFIYLDSAATSQKPQVVIDAITNFYTNSYATVHRSLYAQGEMVTTRYEVIRKQTAQFINAQHVEEIIFTKGTTESINFVADAWARKHLKAGDEILLTQVEHHANLLPWQRVARETGAIIKFIPLNKSTFMLEYTKELVTSKTKLVAVTHTSNVLGAVWQKNQLEQLIVQAHQVGARVLIDAAQSVTHEIIDVQKLNPDFLVFSTHKAYGPTGLGILFIKKELHDHIEPYQLGGSMVYSVSYESVSWAPAPQKFEAGTPPIASVMGWGATLDYLATLDRDALYKQETALCKKLIGQLRELKNLEIIGNRECMSFLVSFKINGLHAHDVASYLGSQNIAVRAGHHCAQPLIDVLGSDSLLRISIGIYNTIEDIEICVTELKNAINYLSI